MLLRLKSAVTSQVDEFHELGFRCCLRELFLTILKQSHILPLLTQLFDQLIDSKVPLQTSAAEFVFDEYNGTLVASDHFLERTRVKMIRRMAQAITVVISASCSCFVGAKRAKRTARSATVAVTTRRFKPVWETGKNFFDE
jgi:hypothetical protein